MKITLIGAGSVVFAKTLLCDILQFPELADCTIALMDLDPARLKIAEAIAKKIVAQLGLPTRIEVTMDARRAIRGANYVICMIQVGGFEPGTVLDFEIPKKFGLRQTIGDTLGVGGVFRGLRTIPVINRLAEHIASVGAPGCLLLNYTNPMAMCCWAVDRAVGIPHVGLCHSVQSTSRRLASYAGLAYEDVGFYVAGINHMAFFLRFEFKGQDAYPLLFAKLEEPGFTEDRVRFEMMRRTGYFVTESSEHQSEYVPYFIPHGEKMVKRFAIPLDEYLRRCRGVIDSWRATEAQLLGRSGSIEIPAQTHEYGSLIIHSCQTGNPRVIYGNVPNRSLIANLPEDCCVEVPCLVDAQGLQPTRVGSLPLQLAVLCQSNVSVQALTVEAALTSKREHVYHAVMADPQTSATLTLDQIWEMTDELLAAHQKAGLLREFAPVIPQTGRSFAGTGDRVIARVVQSARGLQVALQNRGNHPVRPALTARLQTWDGRTLQKTMLRHPAPAGRTTLVSLSLSLPKDIHDGFRVTLTGSDVLAIDLAVPPRRLITNTFELALGGSPAVQGEIQDAADRLNMRIRVHDSNVVLGKLPWSGSCVEMFFVASESASPLQVILVPGKGRLAPRLVTADSLAVPHATLRQKSSRTGYEVDLSVSKKSLRLAPDARTFLFECYASLNALGEAHSGGRTSLSGHFEAHLGAAYYTRVQLNPL
jgi:alpha-galactosidase/6-phospho-beta-glucosidase family protein